MTILLTACANGEDPNGSVVGGVSSSSAASPATGSDSSSESASRKADPNTIVAAFETEPGKLDPQNNPAIVGIMIERQIYEPLIDKDPKTGELIPCLATAWEWKDETHLALTLREGVKFHNGEDFTAEDVMKTLERIQVGSASASLYRPFDPASSEIIDDYHITIAFSSTFAPALNFLTNGRAYVVPADYLAEKGEESLNQTPVGTGPFKFVKWMVSSHIDLVRNDDYWGDKVSYENLMIRFITDDTARMVALETGELDIAAQIQGADMRMILDGGVDNIVGYMVPGQQVNFLAMNETFEPFRDIRVRKAMAHAVDWEAAVQAANGEMFALAKSCVAPTIEFYKEVGIYEYDPELSKQLLKEAGYEDGLNIDCIQEEVPASVRLLEIVQSYFEEVGIRMEIQVVDTATSIEANTKGTAILTIGNMTATTGDPAHTLNGTVANASFISFRITDKRYNELYDAGLAEMDAEKRGEIYTEIQKYVYENVFQLPMFVKVLSYGVQDYIEGFYPDPGQQVVFKNISVKSA